MTQKVQHIKNSISIFFVYIQQWYRLLARYFAFSCIKQIIGYKKYSLVTQTFQNDIVLLFPNNHLTLLVVSEIFLFEMLKSVHWCECVLDIGWYVWESAIYLSKNNKKVIVFEPDVAAYTILKKNIDLYDNIVSYNQFVTLDGRDLYIDKKEDIDCGARWTHEQIWTKITSISIRDVLVNNTIDGIKIDIEWWEYEILEYMVKNNLFTFTKWFIEFHFYERTDESKQFFIDFCQHIQSLGYTYRIFDNANQTMDVSSVHHPSVFLCNLSFEQWN